MQFIKISAIMLRVIFLSRQEPLERATPPFRPEEDERSIFLFRMITTVYSV